MTCLYCGKEIIQADVDRMLDSEKEERLRGLFNSQPHIKKLDWAINFSLLMTGLGMFFGGMFALWTANLISQVDPGAVGLLGFYGLVFGMMPGFIIGTRIDNKKDKILEQFKLEHWLNFESGN
ncbi:MAG: hypothetical protein HYT64_00215 [Candidatus Yanofskybacteria bacterium]|nr:hypothetical protein [Candidatus Yanofskybacteria bacterium]